MRTSDRPLHFASAAAMAVMALAARAAVTPWLGTLQPYAPGFVAVAASVLFVGWRPAVLAAVICYVGGTYLFVPQGGGPVLWTRPQDIAALLTYATSSGLIILIGHRARRAERQLADANEQLRDADRKKNEFLATLSHELRNPVGVIKTAVSVLEVQAPDPRTRGTLAILSRQATQIGRLVDDLLDLGRITRGRMALQVEAVDLRRSVADAVDASATTAERRQQRLTVRVPEQPLTLAVDHARIVQVLSNLIDNASKYSPERSEIRVTLSDDGAAVINVSDEGPGIDPQILPHVFDIFDQGGVSASGGLGLGLGLCKHIVEMHGGAISAGRNPAGKGSSFVVRLPRGGAR